MTIIAWDGKTVATDRQGSNSGYMITTQKLWVIDRDTVVAGAGPADRVNHMVEWFRRGADPDHFPDYKGMHDEFVPILMVFRRGQPPLRYEWTPFPMTVLDAFTAAGSGRDFAVGAMAMGANATKAVAIACDHCTGCGRGIDHYTFD